MNFPSSRLMHLDLGCRPVDARWHRILDLVDRGKPPKDRADDLWIKRGLKYLKTRHAHRKANPCDADLDEALAIYSHQDRLERAQVDAYFLVGATPEEVAEACAVALPGVIAYEKLFFDVRDRLGFPMALSHVALGKNIWRPLSERDDKDVFLRMFAMRLGKKAIPQLVRFFRDEWSIHKDFREMEIQDLEELSIFLGLKAAVQLRANRFDADFRGIRTFQLAEELQGVVKVLKVLAAPPTTSLASLNICPQEGSPKLSVIAEIPESVHAWWEEWRPQAVAA